MQDCGTSSVLEIEIRQSSSKLYMFYNKKFTVEKSHTYPPATDIVTGLMAMYSATSFHDDVIIRSPLIQAILSLSVALKVAKATEDSDVNISILTCTIKGQKHLGFYSLSGRASYREVSWILEAARFGFRLFQSRWNLKGGSAVVLSRYLLNLWAIRSL